MTKTSLVPIVLLLVVATPCAASSFTFTTVTGQAGWQGLFILGINDRGQTVGQFSLGPGPQYAFFYNGSSYTQIFDPNETGATSNTSAYGINDAGEVVGSYQILNGNGSSGFTYNGSGYTTVSDPAAPNATMATAIGNNGLIAGWYSAGGTKYGFIYNGSSWTTLSDPLATSRGGTYVTGVNSSGEVVGYYTAPGSGGEFNGFLFNGSTYTDVDDPNACAGCTYVAGINDSGEVVGWYDLTGGGQEGFIFDGSTYTTIDDPAASPHSTLIWSVNGQGELGGSILNSAGTTELGVTAQPNAPEPGTSGLLLGALVLAAATRRRGSVPFRRHGH